uniref:Ion transport domain-containing protein n=1 Tax=Vitrella brassicaformis TaxID=1169539 RepID=A0A7S1P7R0_9ALVE|mmetsp:Transcript_39047/g.97762  ORF Transcript_39047/g.97762 Transcript_39047/m.97762 type:complete len:237 (+) Transcript_39047:245-955(+)
MAFTWDAIESSQHAHYHMLRLRLLNEYLYMPTYERIPPPFSLISLFLLAPARSLMYRISAVDETTCLRILGFSLVAVLCILEFVTYIVAFTPVFLIAIPFEWLGILLTEKGGTVVEKIGFFMALPCVLPIGVLSAIVVIGFIIVCDLVFEMNATVEAEEKRLERRLHVQGDKEPDAAMAATVDKWCREVDGRKATMQDVMTTMWQMNERIEEIRHSLSSSPASSPYERQIISESSS